MCEVFLETLAAAGGDFRVIQISERADQACAQPSSVRRFVRFRLPPQRRKCWAQERSGILLEFFSRWPAAQQTADELQDTDDLFAFGQISGSGQLFDQSEVERGRRATGLHKRPSIALKTNA